MPALNLAPRFLITEKRLHGCTPWIWRLLTLFSYGRCLSVNKRLGHLIVSTRRLWIRREVRVVNFERISHIVYRAQAVPVLAPWRLLSDASGSWAFFIVALALKDEHEELQLFTIWQTQPRPAGWLDKLAGDDDLAQHIGDETARSFIETLTAFTGARVASRAPLVRPTTQRCRARLARD